MSVFNIGGVGGNRKPTNLRGWAAVECEAGHLIWTPIVKT